MKTLVFSFIIFCFFSFENTKIESDQCLNCAVPVNLNITAQSNNAISFDWDNGNSSFTEYQIFYIKDDGQKSAVYSTSQSEISFSGLAPGVYQFHFYAVCGDTASAIIIEDSIFG